ncbi:hypothetical protein [Propionimicrobium sp. PCR01-08-3]|uniref:hypothetical protein n=1 Tax=Propionimicrobium sp. PCR01-08-3 TaxID=3052086 RepID=UPI00255C500A|nr:hypothetical protein [Propionimicrobium sp. PCR01-08-3]WIY82361.1 hypothetical protein QQ658_12770 [Propionimicrobium sp. PCR01-08-3]
MNQVGEAVVGDAIENLKNAVMEAVDSAGASLGTLWVNVGTPDLTQSSRVDTTADPQQAVSGVLSYVMWIGLAVGVIRLIIISVKLGLHLNPRD